MIEQGWIGRSLPRREDPPLLRGEGRYSADPAPPGLLHLAIRRAGVPFASGLMVDLGPALAMPGVAGAWRSGELGLVDELMPEMGPVAVPIPRPVLVSGAVRFEGDAVAALAAETEYQAQDAIDAIGVEMNEGEPDATQLPPNAFAIGDAAAAFAAAPVTVRQRLRMARIAGAAVEPRAALAEWQESEQLLRIRASIGGVHVLRETLCRCLGLERDQVLVISDDVGGSFGAKNHPYPEYVITAAASRLLKRPVKWVAGRSEDGHTTGQSHAAELDLEIAAEADGRLRGLRGTISWSVGAYVGRTANQHESIASHMLSAYRLPSLAVEVAGRVSHTPPAAFIRGGGRPVGNFGIERMMDRLARRLGMDPIELRRRNLVPPEAMPYTTGLGSIVFDGGDYPRLLEAAVARIGADEIRIRQRAGEPIGVGLALCTESTGIGVAEPSRVEILADGTARAYTGSTPQGQGHRTFLAQVVADRLGWPLERVEVMAGDSRHVPFSMVTAGSRSALEMGNSVALSAASARRILLERAGERLEAGVEDLVVSAGGVGVRGAPGRLLPLAELVGDGLEAAETWDSKGQKAWASSCHAACVGVDPETGAIDVLRYVIAHDSGRPINPMTLEGQLHGGYAHGLGYALFEEAIHSPDGYLLSSSFLDYTIVTAAEVSAEPELIHTETPSTQNPEGFRGAGESGTIAVPAAIANAVEDALYAMGREICVDEIPITPLRLWDLLQG